jgi:endonuclease/exonuclease/phosphatase family metal-dependent hydrolase
MKNIVFALFTSLCAMGVQAQGAAPSPGGFAVTVASLNMGWWMSQQQNAQVLEQCNQPSRQWCDTRYADTWPRVNGQPVCEATSAGLAPCNAFAVYDSGIGSRATATTAPLQVPTAAWFTARQRAMNSTLRRLDADVYALQEISGVAGAREAFGNLAGQFQFCESDAVPADKPQAQKLVFAWRSSIQGACKTDTSIAVDDEPGQDGVVRKVRPALVATLQVGGKPMNLVNLHLKSGCASPAGDGFYTYQGDYLDSERNACKTLRRQVPPLEALMKSLSANGGHAVVLGDFNRKLDMELNFRAGHARAVGGRCGIPLQRSERSNNVAGIANPADQVCLMWPEINDDPNTGPGTSNYTLLRQAPRKEGEHCSRNHGLDHITVSAPLRDALRFVPQVEEIDLATFGQDKQPASDHCPLRATLKFK